MPPAIQQARCSRIANTMYAMPKATAASSAAATEHLHHQHGTVRPLEAPANLLVQRLEHAVIVAAQLRAHRVGDDGKSRPRLEALDEVEDRRNELAGQRVEAHLDGDMHGGTSE